MKKFIDKFKSNKILIKLFSLVLIFGVLASCFIFPSAAAEASSVPPSDLTGYTVSVPANWTASAGYGLYYLEGTYINEYGAVFDLYQSSFEPHNFGIGYENDGSIYQQYPDYIGLHIITHAGGGRSIWGGEPFSLSITGGSDTSTSSLIQWFEDNDATFVITEPSYVVPSGMYRLDIKSFPFTTSNDVFHLDFDFSSVSQDSFDGLSVSTLSYNGSRYISDVYYYSPDEVRVPVILNDGSPGSPHYVTKSEGYTFIYLSEDVDLGSSENLSLFNSLFTPFSGDFDDAMLFYSLGDIDGETSGYKSGYLVGLDEGLSRDLGDTLLGNTLEAPMKALNSFVLYETSNGFTITLGGVIGGAICLTLFIAFLKLFAGG